MRLHATAVARHGPGGWRAVLLRGPSGSGKSDLALRLIGRGWRLVGDDYVEAWASGGRLFATAAPNIAGLIEARGVGLRPCPPIVMARAVLLIDCVAAEPERLPELDREALDGVGIPRLALRAVEASAADKIQLALHSVGA